MKTPDVLVKTPGLYQVQELRHLINYILGILCVCGEGGNWMVGSNVWGVA